MSLSSSNADLPGVHLNSVVNAPHQFSYESGVLHVFVPKKEAKLPEKKTILIEG